MMHLNIYSNVAKFETELSRTKSCNFSDIQETNDFPERSIFLEKIRTSTEFPAGLGTMIFTELNNVSNRRFSL